MTVCSSSDIWDITTVWSSSDIWYQLSDPVMTFDITTVWSSCDIWFQLYDSLITFICWLINLVMTFDITTMILSWHFTSTSWLHICNYSWFCYTVRHSISWLWYCSVNWYHDCMVMWWHLISSLCDLIMAFDIFCASDFNFKVCSLICSWLKRIVGFLSRSCFTQWEWRRSLALVYRCRMK